MRKQLRNLVLSIRGSLYRPSPGIHIINAHYLDPIKLVSGDRFENQVRHIIKYGSLIRIEEAAGLIQKRRKVNSPLIAFTFDDGFEECYHIIAPILEAYNTNAAFFVNPCFIERDIIYEDFSKKITKNSKNRMDWEQIKDLKDRGHIIGAHTIDHKNLGDNSLTESDLIYQIVQCKNIIEEKINNNCNMFAFPYGRFEHLTEKALKISEEYYEFIFSGTNYKNYFSFNGRVINRRHIEPFWPLSHLNYFLSVKKQY